MAKKTIALKNIGIKKDAIQELVLADRKKAHPIAQIYGVLTSFKESEKETQDGDTRKFVVARGLIKMVSLLTGEVAEGKEAFLPACMNDELKAALGANQSVEFAATLTAQYDEKAPTSYFFDTEWAGQSKNEVLSALEEKYGLNNVKALPAPKSKKKA